MKMNRKIGELNRIKDFDGYAFRINDGVDLLVIYGVLGGISLGLTVGMMLIGMYAFAPMFLVPVILGISMTHLWKRAKADEQVALLGGPLLLHLSENGDFTVRLKIIGGDSEFPMWIAEEVVENDEGNVV